MAERFGQESTTILDAAKTVTPSLYLRISPVKVYFCWHFAYFSPPDRLRPLRGGARFAVQEAKNRPNIEWQEKIHGGILRGLRNISETPSNNGMKFLLRRAKWGISLLLSHRQSVFSEDPSGVRQHCVKDSPCVAFLSIRDV